MDLIYTNASREDIGVLHDYTLDLAIGADENDFELVIDSGSHCCQEDCFLYIEGTEYGGIIDNIGSDTEKAEITYSGRTWHGILNSKVLAPDTGADYLTVSGEANSALASLIARMGLSDLFVASSEDSGITLSNYKMNRYIKGYDGIRTMLKAYGAKLKMVYNKGFVELSAKPIVDYSKDEQFDRDLLEFVVKEKRNVLNHVICLGKGNLADREVIHVYADANGNITDTQAFIGIEEICVTYENANVDSDELRQGGIDMIKEAWSSDELDINFNSDEESYDIGDIVGAVEQTSGVVITTEITKKIVTIGKNSVVVSYPCGDTSSKSSNVSTGGVSPSPGNSFEIGVGLKMTGDTLSVDSARDFGGDNTRPVEAAFMQTMIGNVEVLLSTI